MKKSRILSDFGKACCNVTKFIDEDGDLSELDRHFIESHLAILAEKYCRWKDNKEPSDSARAL